MRSIRQVGAAGSALLFLSILLGCGGGAVEPTTLTLTAVPSTINAGETATLTWTSTNADRVLESNFGATTLSGSLQVSPAITTTYYIVVSGPGGQARQEATVTVTANTPPRASFTVTPTSGDTSTVFQFDASGCSDDQEPTTALQVRWDWQDDGTYDTAYSTTKTASHQYTSAGTKTIRLQVRDTGGLTDATTNTVTVTAANTPPSASFTVSPSSGDTSTVFQFDGTDCTDAEDPPAGLQVRWDWENDGTYDTAYSTTKTASHQYTSAGTKTIRLQVRDTGGLTDATTNTVTVTAANTPPSASFTVSPSSGDVNTVFQFDASGCTDNQDPASALQVRWDLDGDGYYDTWYSTAKTATYQYDTFGTYTIGLEVIDTGGLTGTTTNTIVVRVSVTIQPQSATVSIGKTQTFTTVVTGSWEEAVTWRVQEGASGGSITSDGVYTAPNTAGTYHVVATSVADPSVSATATVTVESGSLDVIVN